ncbi:hypothetical protein [Sphingomonas sp. TREG-RG-20F-R18-01]|nr:hypothetical protein [Sphingomonas sp. TREG-RG-20F-R18-01]
MINTTPFFLRGLVPLCEADFLAQSHKDTKNFRLAERRRAAGIA